MKPVLWVSGFVEKICVAIGIEPFLHPRRVGFFTKNRNFSIDKARSLLGYEPEVSVNEGFERTIEWSEQNGYLN